MNSAESLIKLLQKCYAKNERTLLAFSGGPDSTALFYLFLDYRKIAPDFYFEAFHLNHRLRGAKGDEDAQFVSRLCEEHQVQLHLYEKDIRAFAQEKKFSLEEAGREARYSIMNRILTQHMLDSISTAHHFDDQLELFLMRLFQGAGPEVLRGMKERSGLLVRPLLGVTKSQLLDFLTQHKIPFCLDHTNSENFALRNQIRNQLVPLISKIFPAYREKVFQLQEILGDYLQIVRANLPLWKTDEFESCMSLAKYHQCPGALKKELLVQGLKSLSGNYSMTYKNLEQIVCLIDRWDGNGHKIWIEKAGFCLLGANQSLYFLKRDFILTQNRCFEVKPGQHLELLRFNLANHGKITVTATSPKPGEQVFFKHRRKVSDFMIDQKIPWHWRAHALMLWNENGEFIGLAETIGGKIYWKDGQAPDLELKAKIR